MARKLNTAICIFGAFMIVVISCAGGRAYSETIKMNVFDRFRNEMAISHQTAAGKFMNPNALAKWNSTILPHFANENKELSHFFAFSMIVPKVKDADLFVVLFNPWVDGALFTQWKKAGETWKMENFYLASGERVRGQATPQSVITKSHIPPLWLWLKGPFLRNVFSYYKDMRTRLVIKDINDYLSWFSLSEAERNADLLRVKLRMAARTAMNAVYLAKDKSGPVITGAVSKFKYDALTRNKKNLASYSRHSGIIAELRPYIIKTFMINWVFYRNNTYSIVLSSSIAPRLFVLMDVSTFGKIERALFSDLESMATMLQTSASTMYTARQTIPAGPVQPTRKVQRYNDASGNLVEIITEKRGGKVTQTTRVNGKVTNVVNF